MLCENYKSLSSLLQVTSCLQIPSSQSSGHHQRLLLTVNSASNLMCGRLGCCCMNSSRLAEFHIQVNIVWSCDYQLQHQKGFNSVTRINSDISIKLLSCLQASSTLNEPVAVKWKVNSIVNAQVVSLDWNCVFISLKLKGGKCYDHWIGIVCIYR